LALPPLSSQDQTQLLQNEWPLNFTIAL
jgi:hypothetical protein